MFIHTLAPQADPRVEPEFPFFPVDPRAPRYAGPDVGPQAAAPLHEKSQPNPRSFNLEVGNLELQDAQGWNVVGAAGPVAVAVDT